MNKSLLSIVMPCYNCSSTLEEAVASIDTQNFSIPYEVVMVDDGSKDETRNLIVTLTQKYKNIRYIFHEVNQGGGAARNTGIKNSTGDLIYCLDSDNILSPNSLKTMIDFLMANKYDGVIFHERRFFAGNNHRKYKSHFNKILDRSIVLKDLFNSSNTVIDNFLYTRESYNKTLGYPTHHGFDTQSFEIRYLSSNNTLRVCPNTVFYHRQRMKNKSYFERVYEAGELSKNLYLMVEDIIYLFSSNTIKQIMSFDIFKNASNTGNNLKSFLDLLYTEDPAGFFYHIETGAFETYDQYYARTLNASDSESLFCRSIFLYKNKRYSESIDCSKSILALGINSPIIYYNILRSSIGISLVNHEKIEDETQNIIESLRLQPQGVLFTKRNPARRAVSLLKKILKGSKK